MKKIFTLCLGAMFALSSMAETINITMTDSVTFMDEVATEGWWMFVGESDEYEVILSTAEGSTTQIAGTYTLADLDEDYSCICDYTNGEEYIFFTAGSVTVTVDDVACTIRAVGSFTGEDGNTYNLDLLFKKPHAEATVNLTFDNGVIGEAAYFNTITAENENDDAIYIAYDEEIALEDLTSADIYYATVTVAGEDFDYYSITLSSVQNADGSYTVTADILCYNNTLYHVIITIPASQGIEDVVLTEKAQKVVVDGMVYIVRDGKMFNIQGAQVR